MMNSTNLIYSMASAARILVKQLGDVFKRVESIKLLKSVVQVTYKTVFGRCSTFLSFTSFRNNFVDRRREDAQEMEVRQHHKPGKFTVFNPQKGTTYTVSAYQEGIDCLCEDYRNQIINFKKGCCKHGYAVLKHLGFSSLAEYIDHHQFCTG